MTTLPPTDPPAVETDLQKARPAHQPDPLETPRQALTRNLESFDSAKSPLYLARVVTLTQPDERA